MPRLLVNRADLQRLARQRLREARILLRAGHAPGAYYLAGYAVECALKACIARKTRRFDFPDKDFVTQSWGHDLTKLVATAGLKANLKREDKRKTPISVNWSLVKDWNQDRRYETMITMQMARDLYAAIARPRDGVIAWLRRYW